jgi:CubicO group peptidase (beta-lactamase class C family)
MFRFDQALTDGTLLKPDLLAEAFQPGVLNDGSETPYGLGFELSTIDGEAAVGHGGLWLGYQGDYERIPARGLTVVVLMNWTYGPAAEVLEAAILKIYLS